MRRLVTPDDRFEIARLYQEEMMSMDAIAERSGWSVATVWKVLDRLDISRHERVPWRFAACSDEEILKMYVVDLMDTPEMAREFGVCPRAVRNRLKKIGVQLRPAGTQGAKLRSGKRGIHGLSSHPLYQMWSGMISRCHNPNNKSWGAYGGNGVVVCKRWRDRSAGFANFLEDMGDRPPGTSIDRIDPFGNYEPANCRWATVDEQSQNKRGSKVNLQRMADEIEMWRERALKAEALLAGLSGRRGAARRLSAVQNHLGQPESGPLAVVLFEFDADSSPAEVPRGHQGAA